mmetsp:Transcript_32093/g.91557  ORF Transcript_32093/g.91557 Transcript_32093/m.91557 type:complete len:146 (-) Transcript_32093:575-1012(-)
MMLERRPPKRAGLQNSSGLSWSSLPNTTVSEPSFEGGEKRENLPADYRQTHIDCLSNLKGSSACQKILMMHDSPDPAVVHVRRTPAWHQKLLLPLRFSLLLENPLILTWMFLHRPETSTNNLNIIKRSHNKHLMLLQLLTTTTIP